MNISIQSRLVVDVEVARKPRYCFRTEWINLCESLYAVVSKFSLANALPFNKIVDLIADPHYARALGVSLFAKDRFDFLVMQRLFGLSNLALREAFWPFDDSIGPESASSTLRYCQQCICDGYHSAVYQCLLLERCPIHDTPFVDRCRNTQCNKAVDYKMTSKTFSNPFGCSYCGAKLFESSDLPRLRFPSVAPDNIAKVYTSIAVIGRKTRNIVWARNVNFDSINTGRATSAFSGPSTARTVDDECLDLINAIDELRFPTELTENAEQRLPLFEVRGNTNPQAERTRWIGSEPTKNHHILKSASDGPWFSDDLKLRLITPAYKAIRRHIWRHLAREHRRCAIVSAKKIWWSMRNENTVPICEDTYAFLNWRMQWEGLSAPQQLFLRPTHAPYGLVIWLSNSAPILPFDWTIESRNWATERVFAMECMWSFYNWTWVARSNTVVGEAQWCNTSVTPPDSEPYSIAVIGDRVRCPVTIAFTSPRLGNALGLDRRHCADEHWAWHLAQLRQIYR